MHEPAPAALALVDRVRKIVETVIPKDEVYIVEIVVRGRQGSRVVEVFLDSDDGVGLDHLASYSREVGFLLEAEEIVKGHYRLNVSSPGADRPIRLPRQMKKHVGRKLAATSSAGDSVEGVLKAADNDSITLSLKKGKVKEEVKLAFETIQEARVVLPW